MKKKRVYITIIALIIVSFTLLKESQSAVSYRYTTTSYSWVELNGDTGANNTGLLGDDDAVGISIGFNFSFYENSYNAVYVSTNGLASFGSVTTQYDNTNMPSVSLPNNIAAIFWDDLRVNSTDRIYYKVTGNSPARSLIVEWWQVDFFGESGPLTFEMILEEGTNNILFQYNTMSGSRGSGSLATIGIENSSGTEGVRHCYNETGKAYSGLALLFSNNAIVLTADIPEQNSYGIPINVSWSIYNGTNISHTDIHYDTQSNPETIYAFSTTPKSGTAGSYSDVINIYSSAYDTFYFVVHANVDGVDNYSGIRSCVFTDSSGPGIIGVVMNPSPTNGASTVNISGTISDTIYGCTNVVTAEYFINQGMGYTITPKSPPYDSSIEEFSLDLSTSDWVMNAEKKIYIRAQDSRGNWGATYTAKIEVTGKGGVFGDSRAPELFNIKMSPNPTGGAKSVKLMGVASDMNAGGSNVGNVEYRLGSTSATSYYAEAKDGELNSSYEEFQKDIDVTGFKAGEIILIYVRASDIQGNWNDYQKIELLTTIDTKARGAITYAYPNVATPTYPKISFLIDNPNNYEVNIKVYNREGIMVREIKGKPYEWDKKDNVGAIVENGLYFYQIKIGEEIKSGKLVIVK